MLFQSPRLAGCLCFALASGVSAFAQTRSIDVRQSPEAIKVDTGQLSATISLDGYVSGIAAGTLVDKRTGAADLGFGLHVMDFLMAPGWRSDGYQRDRLIHGDLPKHYVEGPQICTRAGRLPAQVIRGKDYVAVRLRFTFTEPGQGYQAGSRWVQTLLFQSGVRHVISSEAITSVNDVDDLFYRIDLPGHVGGADRAEPPFDQVYLSYRDGILRASELTARFGPDERFLYQRNDAAIPERMIRAYRVRRADQPGPWLAGMTLDPAAVSEAWCHNRGYLCLIQELHRRPVRRGEVIGAAYVIGWFDDVEQMKKVYDQHRDHRGLEVDQNGWRLTTQPFAD